MAISLKDKAVENYTIHRCNCAESVAMAWRDVRQGNPDAVEQMAGCGHGRAPGGLCGALHAACQLAGPEMAETIKSRFSEASGGGVTCREIRNARVMRCVDCVAQAALLLGGQDVSQRKGTD